MSFYSSLNNKVRNSKVLNGFDGLGLLALRLWLAQEFINAGLAKVAGGWQAPAWFGTLDFPIPVSWLPTDVNWAVAAVLEIVLGAALAMGLLSRLAALGLLFVTWVAVYSVHFDLGWAGWNQIETDMGQGFKVPLMIALMLLTILTQGAGRYALDWAILRLSTSAAESKPRCNAIQT